MAKKKRPIPRRTGKRLAGPLSQRFDVWQADFRQTPHWIKIAGQPIRPWIVLITSRSDDLVLAHQILEEPPSANVLWDALTMAMREPAAGEPHRPTELQVRPDERWDNLKNRFDELGINVVRTNVLDHWDAVFKDMARHLGGEDPPGMMVMPGMKPDHIASFYRAAAKFYRRAPWRKVGGDLAVQVECNRFQSGPWYAVVMGQAGVTFGLTLYDDLNTLENMWAGNLSDEESARATEALTVTFGDETCIPVFDLDDGRKFGWEVAGPAAYPWIFRKERGLSVRPPLTWELELMEGCLHAILSFVARHTPDDPEQETITVPVASGDLSLTLSWVGD